MKDVIERLRREVEVRRKDEQLNELRERLKRKTNIVKATPIEKSIEVKVDYDYSRLDQVEGGKIAFSKRVAYVYPKDNLRPWGVLLPLVRHPEIYEIFVRGDNVWITHSRLGRLKVVFPDVELNTDRIVSNLAIVTGVRLNLENPVAYTELDNWRLILKLPLTSGEPELTATRITRIPSLSECADPLLAVRLIMLALSTKVIVFTGPTGSGKTTLLNSLLYELVTLYPMLRISIVESVPELIIPKGIAVSRSYPAGIGDDVTRLLRIAMQYERPDIIVLGELRGDEVFSWIEAGRMGITALTTFHSTDVLRAISSMAHLMEQRMPHVEPRNVLNYVDVFVLSRRYISGNTIKRSVEEVYLSYNNQGLLPIYIRGVHIDDKTFLRSIKRLIVEEDPIFTYKDLLENYHVDLSKVVFNHFDPIPID